MKKAISYLAAGLACLSMATPASAAVGITFRIIGYVPVSCDVEMIDAQIQDQQLVVTVRRSCNTYHSVTFAGQQPVEGAGFTIAEASTGRQSSGAHALFVQPERFVDMVDRYTVTGGEDATEEDLLRFAQSLRIGIETA